MVGLKSDLKDHSMLVYAYIHQLDFLRNRNRQIPNEIIEIILSFETDNKFSHVLLDKIVEVMQSCKEYIETSALKRLNIDETFKIVFNAYFHPDRYKQKRHCVLL